ncbi:hypothetical protein TCAL_11749 [Tigriopus californicus]|uniref:Septin n=1 Tax=Tigriopus californicus TaxID=6832 RepID=A0A553P5U2_TIGCA|nr:hypothetical protein TCAL_11749 [Tigriopus californicus]
MPPDSMALNGGTAPANHTSGAGHPSGRSHLRTMALGGHVGFDSLPDQLVNKAVHGGFTFNILSIGETGLGKSTLMDSLFNTAFEAGPSTHQEPWVKLKAHTYELEESNVKLKLTLCDTVGYGDQVNKEDSFKSIVNYIDAQFENYLQEELKIKRNLNTFHDSRIHVCLYFVTPNGHGLKSIDLVCMKKLDTKVNIIPIIAKADTVNKQELSKFKAKIMSELLNNGVQIYQFPENDDTIASTNKSMNSQLPFAVVGSTEFVKVGQKTMRARQYPWGVMGFTDSEKPSSFAEQYTLRRENHLTSLQAKEDEMRQKFVMRVKEKESELKEAERELHSKFDDMKINVSEEKKRVEDQRRILEDNIADFHRRKAQYEAEKANSGHHTLTLGKLGKKK